MTTEEFIIKAKKVHGDRYDYSKVTDFENKKEKITIICPIHGEFLQSASSHLRGYNCAACSGSKKKTTEEFVALAKEIYPEYDYSKVEYKNATTKVLITCPKHGDFWAIPRNTLANHAGCPECGRERERKCFARSDEEFKTRALKIFPNYDFSHDTYCNLYKKIRVTCDYGHTFEMIPKSILQGHQCPECSLTQFKEKNRNAFIEKAKSLHGDKYDYSLIYYVNNDTPIKIICKEHGSFYQTPSDHLKGYGCGWCSGKQKHTTETWVNKVKNLYGGKYTFEHTEYINNKVKVIVTCPEHGDFEVWPNNFAKEQQGCCLCHNSSQNNLFNKLQHEFSSEIIKSEYSPEWLGLQRFDIYFPKYNIAIEYDGELHFIPIKYFGGEIKFKKCLLLDKLKNDKCEKNDCKLFRVKYNYTDLEFESLVSDIKNIINKYTEKE